MNDTLARVLPRIASGSVVALTLAVPADAQRLWNIEEVATQRLQQIAVDGMAMSAAAAGAPTAEMATVQVAFDYLRLGMGYLELPLPDGSLIAAENAVFEDRGNGNLMWTGQVSGAGYESVLFTVQDGHLVGWFGEPGGPKYVVYAGSDGNGSLAEEVGPTGGWCGVEAAPSGDLVRKSALARSHPASVASRSSDSRLDILLLYTTGAERYWRVIGGAAVGVQQYSDYLNMILRNAAIPATANLIAEHWDPGLAVRPSANGYHYQHRGDGLWAWHAERFDSPEVYRLRTLHTADMVYFLAWTRMSLFPDLGGFNIGGASVRTTMNPLVHGGWNVVDALYAFPHEIGHMLGGRHEPAELAESFAEVQSKWAVRPFAFGHTDLTSCSKREGFGDLFVCPRTVMSYGVETWDDPRRTTVEEPFYSSVRHKPNGWTIGVAGTSEVERVFYETVPVAVRSGEEAPRHGSNPRRIQAVWTSRDSVRVTWREALGKYSNARVYLSSAEGANDRYNLVWKRNSTPPVLSPAESHSNLKPILQVDGSQIGVDVEGLRPGGRYRIAVHGPHRYDGGEFVASLSSDVYHLEPPGLAFGSPAAASNVGARVTGSDRVRLHWRDNSRVETGYEVWYRKWSGEEPDEVWRQYRGPLPASTRYLDVEGLAAEEEIRVTDDYFDHQKRVWIEGHKTRTGRYSFVVVAYNHEGWNASETFDLEFMPGHTPNSTAPGETTDCRYRPTGIDLDGYEVHACLEAPDGTRRRAWDYQLEADQSGLLYFFDRDNAEILVKVLDGCAINGHRWVFLAPVTTLPFRLRIREPGPYLANRGQVWYYDSERRPQDRIQRTLGGRVGNPKDRTARTVSDTTAFPCTTAEIAAAKAASSGSGSEPGFGAAGLASSPRRFGAGSRTDCEAGGPMLELRGGYTVSMCYETYKGEVGHARDWGLDSSQSGLMYFFERNNAEVLIKVLDGCGVNGHRWVFVAPVTDLAFNLVVESPDGQRWIHTNRLGQPADAASDTSAFSCVASS